MIMNKLITILIITLYGFTPWVSADERTPEQIVEQTSAELLTVINEQSDRIKNEEQVKNREVSSLVNLNQC